VDLEHTQAPDRAGLAGSLDVDDVGGTEGHRPDRVLDRSHGQR
jgi:hypothetical protein